MLFLNNIKERYMQMLKSFETCFDLHIQMPFKSNIYKLMQIEYVFRFQKVFD
jgi:hypothetical protein